MDPKKSTFFKTIVSYLFLSTAITVLITLTPFSINSQAYEGFGAVTRGALDAPGGYEIFHVTTLEDNDDRYNPIPGSFRDAVDQSGKDGRYVVFDVGGTITLRTDLVIQSSYVTIDGSSAPYPGITIDQFTYDNSPVDAIGTAIEPYLAIAHDIIINNLRMIGPGRAGNGDILGLTGFNGTIYNVIIDHCTAIATGDGVFDTTGDVSNITLSWNLIMDNYLCTLIRYTSNVNGNAPRSLSLHHNVYARNSERQPIIGGENEPIELIDHVNNVVYGWDSYEDSGFSIFYSDPGPNPTLINVENNVFHLWENGYLDLPEYGFWFGRGPNEGDVYINGNIAPPGCPQDGEGSVLTRIPIPTYAEVTKYAASTLGDTVVPCVGTHYPTQEEKDLLHEISIAIGGKGEACSLLYGDVNKDGKVNIQDVQACVNHISGTQDWGNAADVNGDGRVDKSDVNEIMNIILGG